MKTPFVLGLLLLSGCAISSVSLSTLDPNPGRRVTAEVSKFNILGLTSLTQERLEQLLNDLNDQCAGAGVTGVTTRTSTTFAIIGSIERVEATGYCRS